MAQMVKSLPATQEVWAQSLGQEDPLQKEMATCSSVLAWKSHGWRSLAGYRGCRESEMTEQLTHTHTHTHTHTCCCSVSRSCLTPCEPMDCSTHLSLSFTIFQNLLKLMSIESVMLSNHLILCCPLLLPSIFPYERVFSNESALRILYPKYGSFSFSISPCNEYSGLISFRIDWFYLLAIQGNHKCFLMHHSLKASILQHSAFFMVQLSHQCSF